MVIPPVESVALMASYTLITAQVRAGNNLPKLESFLMTEENLPALPVAGIAPQNPYIAELLDKIKDTVQVSMEPPLQLKTLYEAIHMEVVERCQKV
ncbi:hypothetical protein FACS189472_18140 [Alphaproteobacteria bacterium]|nr:hypothetical protein FACS189472_18140 [Alphaproteobacteria bacterium]